MNSHSLRTRIMIFSIVPILILGIGMVAYFSLNRYSQLNNTLISNARNIIYPLSTSVSFAMTQKNVPLVQGLINEATRNEARDVLAIAVFDADNKMLVTSSITPETALFKLSAENDEYIYTKDSTKFTPDGLIMRMPIYAYNSDDMLTLYSQLNITNDTISEDYKQPIFADPKLEYPRELVGYICIYFLREQTLMNIYQDITIAILLLIVAVLICVLLAINLNRKIVDPINSLCAAIYEIREGNVTTRVNEVMFGELERLRSYVNSMANAMSDLHSEMQYSIDTTTNDLKNSLEKLEKQALELKDANFKAEDASKIKSEFLANMSHELRTPLNGIIGFTKQLYKSTLSTEQVDFLATIERSANALLSIVNNILDFSKLEANKLSFENISFSLRTSCYDTLKLLAGLTINKDVELAFDIDKNVPDSVIGDPIRFQQIITNLIGNAIKFTPKGGVAIHIKQSSKQPSDKSLCKVEFSIQDTGIGISKDKQKNLFIAFSQADSSINRKYGGTGLGLVITKHLIEQYDGSIKLESQEGMGTTFTFTLNFKKGKEEPVYTQKLIKKKIIVSETNTWVRASICQILEQNGAELYPMPNLLPINSLPSISEFEALIIGINKTTDLNKVSLNFNNIKDEIIKKIKRVIFVVKDLDADIKQKLLNIYPQAFITSKPLFPNQLFSILDKANTNETKAEIAPTIKPQNSPLITTNNTNNLNNLIKTTILAVDDNVANLKLISTLLKDYVTDVFTASNGLEAVELCSHTEFNLIFMDIQMPIMDGLSAIKQIKKTAANANTPIIAVSALVIESEQKKFIEEGMADYLAKPLDEKQLKQIVEKYCGLPSDNSASNQAKKTNNNNSSIGTYRPTPYKAITTNNKKTTSSNDLWSTAKALQQVANKKELAIDMLQLFIDSIPAIKELLNNVSDQEPLEFAKKIHKFAGGAVYTGVNLSLKTLCNTIESALKNGESIDNIEPELLELNDILERIEKEATSWMTELKNL